MSPPEIQLTERSPTFVPLIASGLHLSLPKDEATRESEQTPGAASPVIEQEIVAAQNALARGDWEDARDLYQSLADRVPSSPEILEGLGWATYWLQEGERSLDARESAYSLYVKLGDSRRACRVAIGLAVDSVDYRGIAVGNGWLARASSLIEQDEYAAEERGWLLLWQGHFSRAFEHDSSTAIQKSRQAAAIARDLGLHDLEMLATALEGLSLVTEGNVREGMQRLDEATAAAMAGEISDLDAVAATCCFLFYACERVRDYDRAAQWDARIDSFAKRWHIRPTMTLCRTQYAAVLVGQGRWDEAETILENSHAVIERTRPLLVAETVLQLAELRRRQGRVEEAMELFCASENRTESLLGRAAISLESDDPQTAVRLLERFLRRELAEKWVARAQALELLVRAHSSLGDLPAAFTALVELQSMAETVESSSIPGYAALARGALAVAERSYERACGAFEEAVDCFDECGTPFEAAIARLELGMVLRLLERPGDARHAVEEALNIARRIGARGLESRAIEALEDPDDSGAGIQGESRLSAREIEVLRLIARGKSNRDVAEELGLSPHTVHRHVANILTKLDLTSRAAAVAAAARMDLL